MLLLSDHSALIDQLIEEALIDEECNTRQIEVGATEVGAEMNDFRKRKRLFAAADMVRWIEDCGLTDERVAQLLKAAARRKKLKKMLTEDKVEKFFAMEKWRFDSAELYLIRVSKRSVAEELVLQIKEGSPFFELAKRFSEDKSSAPSCGYLGHTRREKLRPELESEIFKATEGSLVGPLESIDGFHIYLVEKIQFAHPSSEILLEIEDRIFTSWLKEKKETANVAYPQ